MGGNTSRKAFVTALASAVARRALEKSVLPHSSIIITATLGQRSFTVECGCSWNERQEYIGFQSHFFTLEAGNAILNY